MSSTATPYLPTIFEARNILPEPAGNWRWSMAWPTDIKGFKSASYNAGNSITQYNSAPPIGNAQIGSTSRLLRTPTVPFGRVENVTTPHLNIDTDDRFAAGQMLHYPRHLAVDEMMISLYEDINYNSFNYLTCWRNMVVDRMHNFTYAKAYKRTVYFFAFDNKDNTAPRLTGIIRDCFPKNPGEGLQYSVNESGIVIIPCEFSVGDIEWVFNPVSG